MRYFKAPELREEGGTPNILGAIRAALACYIKLNVGVDNIFRIHQSIVGKITKELRSMKNIILLDDPLGRSKIPVFSFVIKHQSLYLHHNYVVSLLNDLFGIQTRGGCLCAGPYVQRLLGLTTNLNKSYLQLLSEDPNLDRHHLRRTKEYSSYEVFRPGVVRLSISYTSTDEEIYFIIEALRIVSDYGWKLLPLYRCNYETGEWHHLKNLQFNNRRWISHIKFMQEGGVRYKSFPVEAYSTFKDCLTAAQKIISDVPPYKTKSENSLVFAEAEHLRWFLLPADVLEEVLNKRSPQHQAPFVPGSSNATCPEMVEYRRDQLDKILKSCKLRKVIVVSETVTTQPYFYSYLNLLIFKPLGLLARTFSFVFNFSRFWGTNLPSVAVVSNDVKLQMEAPKALEPHQDKETEVDKVSASCALPKNTYKSKLHILTDKIHNYCVNRCVNESLSLMIAVIELGL